MSMVEVDSLETMVFVHSIPEKPLPDNPYAGTHVIRWEHINFPCRW